MSKPNDIPQNVWDAADAVGVAIHGRHERGWVAWPLCSTDGRDAQEIVARALLAEREACAVAAEVTTKLVNGDQYAPDYIADAIRQRGKP